MSDLNKSIHKTLERISKKFDKKKTAGTPLVMTPGDPDFLSTIPYGVSTQSLSLDIAIGRPGLPAGRLTEVAGLDGSSKSTLTLHLISQVQKMGGIAVLIETESGFASDRAALIGVDVDSLIIGQPESMEQAFMLMEAFITDIRRKAKFNGPFLVVWDSVAATPVDAELEGNYDDALMGAHARVIARSLRKLVGLVAQEKVTLVFVNQLKSNLGATYGGDEYVTFGGKSIRYMASLRFQVRRRRLFKPNGTVSEGLEVVTKIIKNKLAAPMRQGEYIVRFTSGIDRNQDLLDTAMTFGLIKKRQGWYTMGSKKFQISSWDSVVSQFGGTEKLFAKLTKYALKKDLMRSYE